MLRTVNHTIIEPKKGWQLIDWKEIREYKDLLYFLVMRDIKALYKQTALGFSWAILRPVLSMIVFSVVFGKLAKMPSDGIPYPIFAYTALLPWIYFSDSVSKANQSLITNVNMLTKIYFPRIFLPLTSIVAGLFDLILSFFVLVVMMIGYGVSITSNIFYIPLLILLMVISASGISLWASAIGIYYRDVRYATQFMIRLMMYAAPVVWPISLIPQKYRLIYAIYPMAGVIEGFRASLLGAKPMPWDLILMGYISALFIFISGAFYFRRMERLFADVA